jgi:hypothetical protein
MARIKFCGSARSPAPQSYVLYIAYDSQQMELAPSWLMSSLGLVAQLVQSVRLTRVRSLVRTQSSPQKHEVSVIPRPETQGLVMTQKASHL